MNEPRLTKERMHEGTLTEDGRHCDGDWLTAYQSAHANLLMKIKDCPHCDAGAVHEPCALRTVVQAVVDWNTKYPSSRIYGEASIRRIAAEMDVIFEQAKSALAGAAQPPEDERTLRRLLAFSFSSGHLYGDDGELQDSRLPHPIDYVRDSVAEIERKINARGMDRLLSESSLLREIDEYLGRSPAEAIHAGSILHQKVKELLQWLPRPSPTKGESRGE